MPHLHVGADDGKILLADKSVVAGGEIIVRLVHDGQFAAVNGCGDIAFLFSLRGSAGRLGSFSGIADYARGWLPEIAT